MLYRVVGVVVGAALLGGCQSRTLYTDYYIGDLYAPATSAEVVKEQPAGVKLIGTADFTQTLNPQHKKIACASAKEVGANVVWISEEFAGDEQGLGVGGYSTPIGTAPGGGFTYSHRSTPMWEQHAKFYRDHSKPGLENSPDVVVGRRE